MYENTNLLPQPGQEPLLPSGAGCPATNPLSYLELKLLDKGEIVCYSKSTPKGAKNMSSQLEHTFAALRPGAVTGALDRQTRTCDYPGCSETTRERKLYCTNHVEQQPYIQQLLHQMKQRDAEDYKVLLEGSKAVNMDGITIHEILLILKQQGPRTEERLARDLQIDKSIVHNYIVALNKKGIIGYKSTARFDQSIALIDDDANTRIPDDDDDA